MHIIVIDDNIVIQEIIKSSLDQIPKIKISTFLNAEEAFDHIWIKEPDLIIVDHYLEKMNGIDFIYKINEIDQFNGVPIILITAEDNDQLKLKALEAGATDFLNKPIDPLEIRIKAHNLLKLRQAQLKLKDKSAEEIIQKLSSAAESRDNDTGEHICRIACYSSIIAKNMNLPESYVERIKLAAPMHDIGKVGIPDSILLKPGKLTHNEMQIMREHTTLGAKILSGSQSLLIKLAYDIALTHHEKYDGTGYPYGLQGEEIPLCGRIVSVADVFDALTTERVYKPAWETEEALNFIKENSGKHFDPKCVDAFFEGIQEIIEIKKNLKDPPSSKDDTHNKHIYFSHIVNKEIK